MIRTIVPDPILSGPGTIEDLGTLGGPSSFGLAINASGHISGVSYRSYADPHSSGVHAFRYDGFGLIDVGALPTSNFSWGYGINDEDVIVGPSLVDVGGDTVSHAFLAGATLTLTDLGTLGGDFSFAHDINNQGQVTGEASIQTGETHAFLWTSGDMQDVGTLGGNYSVGRSINDHGQIAGESRIGAGDTTRAFCFTEGTGMISLGALGGKNSSAYGINNSGQIVGETDTGPLVYPVGLRAKGFLFFGTHAFLWTEGVGMKDLGHLSGGTSRATAVNNDGVVVGTSTLLDGTSHAFRWTDRGGMIDLNTLLPTNSGWILYEADGVNDRGQITGNGLRNGNVHAFRWDPPEIVSVP
jgi:probable HAF family extracellular repeat protein